MTFGISAVRLLFVFGLVASGGSASAWADDSDLYGNCEGPKSSWKSAPIHVSLGNGHLSGIYASKHFILQTLDGRVFEFTRNATRLQITKGSSIAQYTCRATRYSHSWGSSTMSLSCGEARGEFVSRKRTHIYLSIEPKKNRVGFVGTLAHGSQPINVNAAHRPEDQREVEFKSLCHAGWIY